MSEIKQVRKKDQGLDLEQDLKDTFGYCKKNIEKYYDYIDDSTSRYNHAFDELKEEFEKIKSLISESGILSINLQEQKYEVKEKTAKQDLPNPNFELNFLKQNQKEEISNMKNEYDQTFAKLEEMRSQLDIIDNQYKQKKVELSKIQKSFDEPPGIKPTNPPETVSKISSTDFEEKLSDKLNSKVNVFEIYSNGFENYMKWVNGMVFSYFQSINDINKIAQSQNQIVESGISLKKNFDNLFGFNLPVFEISKNEGDQPSETHSNDKSLNDFSERYFNTCTQSMQNMTEMGTKFLESWLPVFKINKEDKK